MRMILLALGAVALFAAASERAGNVDVSLVRVPNGGIQPQAVLDRNGVLHLLYYAADPAHGDLFYVKSSDAGRTWSLPLRVNSQSGAAIAVGTIRGGQIAIGGNGRVHVAWNGSSQAEPKGPLNPESGQPGAPMLYSRLNDSHTAFEPERNLMTRTFGLDGGGALAADSAGHVYVAWHGKASGAAAGETGRQVWIVRSDDDGKTFNTEQPAWNESTGACGCCGMAMNVDSKGAVRILYRSATDNVHRDIYLLTSGDHAHSFEGRKLHPWEINACPMSSMAFSEAAGQIEGAWETGGQVYFENLTKANAAPVSAPGESKGHKHPRLASGSDATTLMTWTEGTGWARGGSLAWQLYDGTGNSIGQKGTVVGVPTWSFGAVLAKPHGFIVIY
ncbi:MAG: hypothetical protein JO182_26715 [Acidobacteriaceae bacterium]|nr:hypothetical protein [Acidobacteriaceae bacterium]